MAFCTNCGSEMEGPFCASCGARSGEATPATAQPVGEPAVAQQPPAKKSKVWIYVLSGCGGLIVLIIIAMAGFGLFIRSKVGDVSGNPALAAAKIVAALNPNVEVVSTDERAGKITLRDKRTGKTVTFNASDVQKGRISFEGDNGEKVEIQGEGEGGGSGSVTVKGPDGSMQFGEGSIAKVPDWVPKYPGAQAAGTFTMQAGTGDAGTFQLKCNGSVDQVASFYERELKGAGMTIQKHSMQSGSGGATVVIGQDDASGRTVSASVSTSGEGTVAHITYQTKK